MGRFLLFIIIIAAALAGVWFYAPGGKDMLLGAKDKAMSYMPGGADAGEPVDDVDVEIVVDDEAMDEEPMAAAIDMDADMAGDDMGGEEAPADEPQE